MRVILAVLALAVCTASAYAQTTTTPAPTPTAPVPPSTCSGFTTVPTAPDGATATQAQITAAVAAFEAWRVNEQATLDCRANEVRALAAQSEARRAEYVAAQADNQARATAFQAQLDVFSARPAARRTAR